MTTKSRTKKATEATATGMAELMKKVEQAEQLGAQLEAARAEVASGRQEVQAALEKVLAMQQKATPPQASPKPTVGLVVNFRAPAPQGTTKVLAGTVACVVDEGTGRVNLTVHAEDATTYPRHDVPYSEAAAPNTWGWPARG